MDSVSVLRALGAMANLALVITALAGCESRSEGAAEAQGQGQTVELVAAHRGKLPANWRHDHDAALAEAVAAKKPVIIDFSASWCVPCVDLAEKTFVEPRVAQEIEARFVAVSVDGTESVRAIEPLMERYGVEAFPTVIFVDSSGQVLDTPRLYDFVPPDEMLRALEAVR